MKSQDPEKRACLLAADALESAVVAGWDFDREDDPEAVEGAMRSLVARLRRLGACKEID